MIRYVYLQDDSTQLRAIIHIDTFAQRANPFSQIFRHRYWDMFAHNSTQRVFRYPDVRVHVPPGNVCAIPRRYPAPPSPLTNKYFILCYLTSVLSSSFFVQRWFNSNGAGTDLPLIVKGAERKMRNSPSHFIPNKHTGIRNSLLIDNPLNVALCCDRPIISSALSINIQIM